MFHGLIGLFVLDMILGVLCDDNVSRNTLTSVFYGLVGLFVLAMVLGVLCDDNVSGNT